MEKNNNNFKLNPYFVTGLTDAEGCFFILAPKSDKSKFKVYFSLKYKISMLDNEIELLNMVKCFFNCGVLRQNNNGTIDFEINDFFSLNTVLIPHFLEYPLRGTKYLDFLSFKEASHIFENREHLRKEGVNKLYIIKNNMNTQRDFSQYNNYTPNHTKQSNTNYIPINGHYINGFIAGDGCLTLSTGNNHFGTMHLSISQHINNRPLLESIANYFNSSIKVRLGRSKDVQIHLRSISL
jgi:LAGLIDADG endonuclease